MTDRETDGKRGRPAMSPHKLQNRRRAPLSLCVQCVCVCAREREREREQAAKSILSTAPMQKLFHTETLKSLSSLVETFRHCLKKKVNFFSKLPSNSIATGFCVTWMFVKKKWSTWKSNCFNDLTQARCVGGKQYVRHDLTSSRSFFICFLLNRVI